MEHHFLHNKRIIIIGNEGAGKGTQIKLLQSLFHLPVIAVGVILRDEIKRKTKIGKQLQSHVDSGRLAPNGLVNQLIERQLRRYRNSGFILDGYPRDPEQIGFLLSISSIDIVVGIIISQKEVYNRVIYRRQCEKGHMYNLKYSPPKKTGICDECGNKLFRRKDTTKSAMKHRERVFRLHTQRVIQAFKNFGIYVEVNGEGSPANVHRKIVKALESFQKCP